MARTITLTSLVTIALFAAFFAAGCRKNCYDPLLKARKAHTMCNLVFSPVTGCDGKRYDNSCEAQKAGIREYY